MIRLHELKQVIEAALEAAEKAGGTTPESRAMIIGSAIDAICSKRPQEVHHHHPPILQSYPPRNPLPPRLRA